MFRLLRVPLFFRTYSQQFVILLPFVRRKFYIVACTMIGTILVCGIGIGIFEYTHAHTFMPGVSIVNIDVAHRTLPEVTVDMRNRVKPFLTKGVSVNLLDESGKTVTHFNVPAIIRPLDSSGNEHALFFIEWQKAITEAYTIGHRGGLRMRLAEQWYAWRHGIMIIPNVIRDDEAIDIFLHESTAPYEQTATNASVEIHTNGELTITPDDVGHTYNIHNIRHAMLTQMSTLIHKKIHVTRDTLPPTITAQMIEHDSGSVVSMLQALPMILQWETFTWTIDQKIFSAMLTYDHDRFVVDEKKFQTTMRDVIEKVHVPPREGHFTIQTQDDHTVKEIQQTLDPVVGSALDIPRTTQRMTNALSYAAATHVHNPVVDIVVRESAPRVTPQNIQNIGIHTLLGTGHSNMANSSSLRRKNIARGAELLNGLLIAPGEIFSLLSVLRPFTSSNGYVAELVIKGDHTTPEMGGGLCQVGTTTFRAVMNAGLSIIERRNHAFAVSWYGDDRNQAPGTDATIYDPSPDFRFQNDTQSYIVFQTRIEKDDLYFDIWGTDDGRKGFYSAPTTSHWIAPPPLKEIPTTTLAPGEQKCTERAHAGVTTSFTYTITYADQSVRNEIFRSVYKPWQAVCLVGETPAPPLVEKTTIDSPKEKIPLSKKPDNGKRKTLSR